MPAGSCLGMAFCEVVVRAGRAVSIVGIQKPVTQATVEILAGGAWQVFLSGFISTKVAVLLCFSFDLAISSSTKVPRCGVLGT